MKVKRLDFRPSRKINEAVDIAIVKKTKAMRLETLKNRNRSLYDLVTDRMQL
jgi:hypothetical protein